MSKQVAGIHHETTWWEQHKLVAGVDEAGRGALAGPVVAAAVVFDPSLVPPGLADSKALSCKTRQHLAEQIYQCALAVGIGMVDNEGIDRINILQATFQAMHLALDDLLKYHESISHVLLDGNRFKQWRVPHTCIVRGDAECASIAAASIIAKTTRDSVMQQDAHIRYPQYGFDRHVGYGTKAHRAIIREIGPCAIHRRSFLGKVLS